MVYNAMKLFMEINPTLFDECSADYAALQKTADQRQAVRKQKWDRIEELAQRNSQQFPNGTNSTKVVPPPKIDEIDPAAQDNQERLDALKLQDDGVSKDADYSNSLEDHANPTSMQ